MTQHTNLIGLFGICLLGLACGDDEESNLTQFNALDDIFKIEVGPPEVGTDQTIELHSSTGQVVIGSATISPGSGPVGTEHQLVVIVDNTWEGQVEQVRLEVDSGERGIEDFILSRDSADPGYHILDVVSVGEENETRTDTFTIQLMSGDETSTVVDTGASQ